MFFYWNLLVLFFHNLGIPHHLDNGRQIELKQILRQHHDGFFDLLDEGVEGLPYAQHGRLQYLAVGQTMDVGESVEMHPPGTQPTTLQRWTSLGVAEGTTQ